jgi:hypothetical protein
MVRTPTGLASPLGAPDHAWERRGAGPLRSIPSLTAMRRNLRPVGRGRRALPATIADVVNVVPGSSRVVIRCGALLDVVQGRLERDRTIVVRDGRIEALLGPDAPAPADANDLDLSAYTVLPGLIDCTHT